MGSKKCVKWGFGYGKFEYQVSFGLAPRNGKLSPSDPERSEPLKFVPGPEPGTDFRFELPAKFGVGRSKLGVRGHIYPEIKGRWLFFLTFEVAKLFFLSCQQLLRDVVL